MMVFKLIEVTLKLIAPYFIRFLVEYVKTGENQFKEYIPFWEIKDVAWLEWLTPEKQYGLFLAILLVATQFIAFMIEENAWFWAQQIGARAMNTLGGFIYEKQL